MLELQQNVSLIAERIKRKLDILPRLIGENVLLKNDLGVEMVYSNYSKGKLKITLTDDEHRQVGDLFDNGEVEGIRKLGVELVITNINNQNKCLMNVGYTPGSTFFRGSRDLEIDLKTNKAYRIIGNEIINIDEWSENTLNIGLNILESKDLRIMKCEFEDENNQVFKTNLMV